MVSVGARHAVPGKHSWRRAAHSERHLGRDGFGLFDRTWNGLMRQPRQSRKLPPPKAFFSDAQNPPFFFLGCSEG